MMAIPPMRDQESAGMRGGQARVIEEDQNALDVNGNWDADQVRRVETRKENVFDGGYLWGREDSWKSISS